MRNRPNGNARGLAAVFLVAAGLLSTVTPASAQMPAPPGAMLPPPTPGMPTSDEAKRLRGVPVPPFPASAEKLPIALLKLPKGFKIEVYASSVTNARSLRLGDKGTVFVGNLVRDKVYAIVDRNGKREVKVIASGLDRPNGLAFKDGTLYIAEGTKISKLEGIEGRLDNPPKPVVIFSGLPNHQSHGWKFMALGPDNRLYFNIGAPCNICMPPPTNSLLRSVALDGSDSRIVAYGIRQVVGMDFHPASKVLYFTENQRDWLSEEEPQDKLNRVLNPGKDNFGFPYCDGGNIEDPTYGWGHSCNDFTKPITQLGPHSAPLGMRFYTGSMFPAKYRGAIFLARHGSWNKTHKIGGDIVAVFLNEDGTVKSQEIFMTGFLQNNEYVGRPVDVQPLKDGSLLISDDYDGAVYRVTYDESAAGH